MALRIEQLFSQLVAKIAPAIHTDDPMTTSVLHWFGSVQASALDQWRAVARSGARCTLRHGNGALPLPCEHVAVGLCSLCRELVCLPHSAVTMGGHVTCVRCMAEMAPLMRERVRARPPAPPPPEPQRAPPPRPAGEDEAVLRKKHLKTMGLKDPATYEEVRAQFRKLALKYHPDRAPEQKRAAASKKMVELNAAYQWLDAHMRKVA